MIELGRIYLTQIAGVTTAVRVVEHEQREGKHRGTWVVRREDGTGGKLHRTTRQLREAPDLDGISARELVRGLMRGNRPTMRLGYSPANAVAAVRRMRPGAALERREDELRGYSQGFSDGMQWSEPMVVLSDPANAENEAYREGYAEGALEPRGLTYPSRAAI